MQRLQEHCGRLIGNYSTSCSCVFAISSMLKYIPWQRGTGPAENTNVVQQVVISEMRRQRRHLKTWWDDGKDSVKNFDLSSSKSCSACSSPHKPENIRQQCNIFWPLAVACVATFTT